MKPDVFSAADFGFDRHRISRAALNVVRGLQEAGYDGYLVGGCVRDLLLGIAPKDFDVATDATPEEVRDIFRRSRIIGRRFRLVHVRFGRDVVEVATYRADPSGSTRKGWLPWRRNRSRLQDDNVYGTLEDDVRRRDFTANALYYDPVEETVLDFLGGVDHIHDRHLSLIGESAVRFREDPVRMLRVLRFKARLDLEPETGLMEAVIGFRDLLTNVPPARLFDEVLKLFHYAHGVDSWHEIRNSGFADILFPLTVDVLESPGGEVWENLILEVLENTDRRVKQNRPVIPAFLYAVLLWRPFCLRMEKLQGSRSDHHGLTWQVGDEVFAEQNRHVFVPRRVSSTVIEIWQMQFQLETRRRRQIDQLLLHKRFRAAYDFLLLRSTIGEVSAEIADWWTQVQDMDHSGRHKEIRELGRSGPPENRKKRRRRRSRYRSATRQTSGPEVI